MSRKVLITIEPGTLLWIPDVKSSRKVFCVAKVLAVDEFTATVRTEGKEGEETRLETLNLETSPLFLANPTVEPDMTGLHYIHEPGIMYNLCQRSLKNEPYTFMGSVLVSVNPLKTIANPTTVGTRAVLLGGPHPYAVAESAFQQMTFQGVRELIAKEGGSLKKASQSIVIGGESGAGKTESSKMVLQHLVNRLSSSGASMNGLDERLLGTNPILEAFGNATTLRNPNSSRFGKMLRLHFEPPINGAKGSDDEWRLLGATVQSYLLERSRVTAHEPGERGYHIMYYTIAGANVKGTCSPELAGLDLTGLTPGKFRYTSPEHPKFDHEWDSKYVGELVKAMEAIGLSLEDRKSVFEVIAGILHMGNLQFTEQDSNEGPKAIITDPEQGLRTTARMLGVDENQLARTFCERRFTVAGTEMVAVRNAKAAGFARDAIAKAIYSGLFDWIMRKIDIALGGAKAQESPTCSIGVLDIFGFETFAVNGFEQLLINYTNEALQGTFNSQIFIAEAALYQKEGLFGTDDYMGQPLDNGICIELLQGNPSVKGQEHGVLMTIDSEGRVPDPSDSKMLQRLHTNFSTHPCFVKPHQKDKSTTFIVRHYAATVVYSIGTFLEKNNDRLPDDMESTLKTSSKATVKDIFTVVEPVSAAAPAAPVPVGKGALAKAPSKAPPPARKPPAKSIVHKFQGQIKQLVDDLESTKCSFIRCVKPNAAMVRNDSDPSWFDDKYVKAQLDALNIAQTAEVLRNGFPTRIEYSTLVDQYSGLMPASALTSWKKTSDNRAFVRALFYAFGINEESFKLGFTRVFFKGGKLAELNQVMKATQLSDEIIKSFLYYLIRIKWRRAFAFVRGQNGFMQLFKFARTKTKIATQLQSLFRMRRDRKSYRELTRGAKMAQKLWRGKQARKELIRLRKERMAEVARKAEEARKRKDQEAIDLADRLEREQKEAQARREREAEAQAAIVRAALEKQKEEHEEQELAKAEKRMSIWQGGENDGGKGARRKTAVAVRGGGRRGRHTVVVNKGGALKPKLLFQAPPPPPLPQPKFVVQAVAPKPAGEDDLDSVVLPPPPRVFAPTSNKGKKKEAAKQQQSAAIPITNESPPPPPPDEEDEQDDTLGPLSESSAGKGGGGLLNRVRSLKRGSFFEFIAQKQEGDFKMPCSGYAFMKDGKSARESSGASVPSPAAGSRKSAGRGVLSRLLSSKPKWIRVYYVMNKPDRQMTLYTDFSRKQKVRDVILHRECKVWKYEDDKKRPYGVELEDPRLHTSTLYAFETETLWRRWMKDVHEAIYGFRPTVPSGKEVAKVNAEPVDLKIVAQLNFLLFRGMITQAEFNDLIQRAAAHEKLRLAGKDDNDDDEWVEGKEEEQNVEDKLPPLERVIGSNIGYHNGRLAFGNICLERKIDFSTFEERLLLNCSVRFHLDEEQHKDKEIGWTVARPFQEYRAMYLLISDPDGPLNPQARLALPPFPHYAFSNSAKFINKVTQEAQGRNVEEWMKKLFSSIPYVEEDLFLDAVPPPPPIIDPSEDPTNWRTIKDPETGDAYYHNKATGETRFEDPFKGREDVCIQEELMDPLPDGWEAIKDSESGQTYYFHMDTEETTWDRPVNRPPGSEQDEAEAAFLEMKRKEMQKQRAKPVVKKFDMQDFFHIPAIEEFFDVPGNVESFVESLKETKAI